jgi:hypothetical protein
LAPEKERKSVKTQDNPRGRKPMGCDGNVSIQLRNFIKQK